MTSTRLFEIKSQKAATRRRRQATRPPQAPPPAWPPPSTWPPSWAPIRPELRRRGEVGERRRPPARIRSWAREGRRRPRARGPLQQRRQRQRQRQRQRRGARTPRVEHACVFDPCLPRLPCLTSACQATGSSTTKTKSSIGRSAGGPAAAAAPPPPPPPPPSYSPGCRNTPEP